MAFSGAFVRPFRPAFDAGAAAAKYYSLLFNGSTSAVNCGSDAGLDNLADNEFTAEAWIKIGASPGANNTILYKAGFGSVGWYFYWSTGGRIYLTVFCQTTNATGTTVVLSINDSAWHHVVMYFNDAGDRKVYMAVDGNWSVMAAQVAGNGAIKADAAANFLIGNPGFYQFKGYFGWCRISNNDRYNHGTNFSGVSVKSYPVVDANTIAQWNMSEGTGSTIDNSQGTAARDGTLTDCTWEEIP